jgi:peptide/nickel transport system substrate-binding protein
MDHSSCSPRYYSAETTENYNASEAKIYLAQEGVKVTDLYTVQITLEHPYAAAIATMAFASFGIISPSYVIKNCPGSPEMPGVIPGTLCEFMILRGLGTGPFKIAEITPKSRVVLERFDEYWGGPNHTGPAKLKRYVIKYVSEIGTREFDLFAGTADAIELPPTNAFDLIDQNAWLNERKIVPLKPGIRVWTAKTLQVVDLYTNPRFKPFDNVLFRQALAYAFPYDKYIGQVLNGFATRRAGEIPEGMLGYDPAIPGYNYDPEKARELFQQVGYKGSIELIVSTGDTLSVDACILIKDSLGELAPDITVKIREVDQASWYTLYHEFKVAARVGKWYQDIADPSVMIANFATQAGFRGLFTQFENETINKLVNEASATLDEAKRVELYREIQLEMLRKLPYIPLCTPIALQAERDWVLPSDSPVGRGVYNPEYGDGDGGLSGGYHAYDVWKAETAPQVVIYIGNSPLALIQNNPYLIAPISPTAGHRYS